MTKNSVSRKQKIVNNEIRMAMIFAMTSWPGTSIFEGALQIMADVRRTHPEQFKHAADSQMEAE